MEIKLTKEKVALVDDHNYKWLSQWSWYAMFTDNIWYAVRDSRNSSRTTGKILLMHRVIVERLFPGFQGCIDHRDHNGLNNHESNLRIASGTQNQANQRLSTANTSGFKGVSWFQKTKRWRTFIQIQGRNKCLGYYDSKETAARCYDANAVTYFGEFAWLNFPEDWSTEKIQRVYVPGLFLLG